MDTDERVANFFSGHGMRQIYRTLKMGGIDPSHSPSMPSIYLAMKNDPTYAIYNPLQKAIIAQHANESIFLSNYYAAGGIEENLPAKTLTPIPGMKILGSAVDRFRYQLLLEFRSPDGRKVETRPINITSPNLLTSQELSAEAHNATLLLISKGSDKIKNLEAFGATDISYRLTSVVRAGV